MTNSSHHPGDDLQLLLDGELPEVRRSEIERHLARCPECRRELAALERMRAVIRAARTDPPLPLALDDRLARALDTAVRDERPPARTARRLLPVGLAAAAVLLLYLLWPRDRPDFVGAAASDFGAFRSATLALELVTEDPIALQSFFDRDEAAVRARVFDFGMMGYRLAGGRVLRFAGRDAVLFAYHGAEGRDLLCIMYRGEAGELPPGAVVHDREGIRFTAYQRAGVTLVFWQEGAVMCVLAANLPPEEAVQLAAAKARRS